MGYRFVTESNHAQESHTKYVNVFRFFSDIFAGPKILLPWQRGVTTFPLYWPPCNIDANMSVLAYPSNLWVCFNFASQTSPFIFLWCFYLVIVAFLLLSYEPWYHCNVWIYYRSDVPFCKLIIIVTEKPGEVLVR